MINSRKQNGSALIVIVIIIAIAVLGVLGYVGWNSLFASKDEVKQKDIVTHTVPINDEESSLKDQSSDYLSLDDWGVKFKLPENTGEVRYYKGRVENASGSFEHYEFSTARVEALGEMCVVDSNEHGSATRLAILSRSVADQADNPYRGMFVNNNQPLGGYYYYMGGAQSMCAEEGGDMQGDDRNLLLEMLKNPIAS